MTEAGERGSGTVLMVIVMAMAGFLVTVTVAVAGAIAARHRAGAIADLSALAAAGGSPGPQACDRARRVAGANAGRLVRCRILGDGSVRVDVELAAGGLLSRTASGSARAGPSTIGPRPGQTGGRQDRWPGQTGGRPGPGGPVARQDRWLGRTQPRA